MLARIAKRIGGTPAQVIFKWVASKGVVIVTFVFPLFLFLSHADELCVNCNRTSTKKERLQEYLAVPDLRACLHY